MTMMMMMMASLEGARNRGTRKHNKKRKKVISLHP
jgi:hypothetical protein